MEKNVKAGSGMWLAGKKEEASAACAFLAGEAMQSRTAVLLYPAEELIGRLRRLAASGPQGIDKEIFGRLAKVDLLILDGFDVAAAPERFPEPKTQLDGEEPETRNEVAAKGGAMALMPSEGEYRPGLNVADLGRLSGIVDERLANMKATVITTRHDPDWLEEDLLRIPGEWPDSESGRAKWDEPRRRIQEVRRLLSRLRELCGRPIALGSQESDGVRPVVQPAAGDRRRISVGTRAA